MGQKQGNDSVNTSPDVNNGTTMAKAKRSSNEVKNFHLPMLEDEIKAITEHLNSDYFNIIDLHFFNGSTNKGELFTDIEFALVNPIGQEILYTLHDKRYRNNYGSWALNAGRKSFDLHVKAPFKGCIESILKQIVLRKENPVNFEICIQFSHDKQRYLEDYFEFGIYNVSTKRPICSRLYDNVTNFKYKWHEIDSVLHETVFLRIAPYLSISLFLVYTSLLVEALFYDTAFDMTYYDYCTLQESRISLPSIILKTVWREKGLAVSFIRRGAFLPAFSYHTYFSLNNAFMYGQAFFFGFTISFLYFYVQILYDSFKYVKEEQRLQRLLHSKIFSALNHLSIVCNMTSHKKCFRMIKTLKSSKLLAPCCRSCRNSESPFLKCILKYTATPLFFLLSCFLYLAFLVFYTLFPVLCLMKSISLIVAMKYSFHDKISNSNCNPNSNPNPNPDPNPNSNANSKHLKCLRFFDVLVTSVFFSILIQTYLLLAYSTLSLLLGLIFNLSYFIPYLASFSVFFFYGYSYWASLEKKYFLLKFLIYKACLDEKQDDNHNPNLNHNRTPTNFNQDDDDYNDNPYPNANPGKDNGDVNTKIDEELLSVVSKDLYETIREKLLPYNKNLYQTGLKLIWLTVISYGIYELLQVLHQFNITSSIQLLITASISIAPKLFDTIALTAGMQEKKEAWKEELQLKVKRIVKNEISKADEDEKKKLLKTILIIPAWKYTTENSPTNKVSNAREEQDDSAA